MSASKPLKLEFQFKSVPHPAGSDNDISLDVTPSGELAKVMPSDYAISIGSGKMGLAKTLAVVAKFAARDIPDQTSQPLEDKITFTDVDDPNHQVVVNLP